MCGRYTLIKLADLVAYFPWIGSPAIMPDSRYNIAPSQSIAVVTNESDEPKVDFLRWGLVPSWAKDGSITAGSRMINARAETLAEKPAFSRLLKRQRCLIPADGFYEWKRSADGKTKIPYRFRLINQLPFAFAGLWDTWRSGAGQMLGTCTIITTSANAVVAPIHNRMPVMLRNEDCQRWISPGELPAEQGMTMLSPYRSEDMEAYPVSTSVGSPVNEGPELIDERKWVSAPPFQPGLFPQADSDLQSV